MRAVARAAALLALLGGIAAGQSLKGIQQEFAAVGDRVIPATVIVRAVEVNNPGITGSTGVIVHEKGYVLSDADATLTAVTPDDKGQPVKRHGTDAVVRLPAPDLREFRAIVVRRDEETDTTLLRITDSVPGRLPFVPLGSSDTLKVGDFNIIVGNAFGSGQEGEPSLSMGAVSALIKRRVSGGGRYDKIYTSAAVNPGCNGGPSVDAEGRIVGIVSSFETNPTSPFRALGIVNPIDRIRAKYEGVEDFALVFPDPQAVKPRSDEAAILENAFAIVAHHAFRSLASLEVKREGAKTTVTMLNPGRQGNPSAPPTIEVPRYDGPCSAVVISADGWILTSTANLWEFATIKEVTAHLYDGRSVAAKVVARDRFRGIALLKVEAEGLVPLPMAAEADYAVGRFALALGNPFGADRQEAPLLTYGIVSGLNRIDADHNAIQTDAGMNDAMIGGALVSLDGKLLGVNLLKEPDRYGRNSGIGFAIPMATVEKNLARMQAGTDIEPGFMGIGPMGKNEAGDFVFPQVDPAGPAGKAGLMAGDVLLQADDRKVSSFPDIPDFINYVRSKPPGVVLSLKVRRGNDEKDLEITLGSRPGD